MKLIQINLNSERTLRRPVDYFVKMTIRVTKYDECERRLYSAWRESHAEYSTLIDVDFLHFGFRAHCQR